MLTGKFAFPFFASQFTLYAATTLLVYSKIR